jgi:hypothetical protein
VIETKTILQGLDSIEFPRVGGVTTVLDFRTTAIAANVPQISYRVTNGAFRKLSDERLKSEVTKLSDQRSRKEILLR